MWLEFTTKGLTIGESFGMATVDAMLVATVIA